MLSHTRIMHSLDTHTRSIIHGFDFQCYTGSTTLARRSHLQAFRPKSCIFLPYHNQNRVETYIIRCSIRQERISSVALRTRFELGSMTRLDRGVSANVDSALPDDGGVAIYWWFLNRVVASEASCFGRLLNCWAVSQIQGMANSDSGAGAYWL